MLPLGVAVIGMGIGGRHVEAFKALPRQFTIAALCDLDAARARQVAEANGVARVTTDVETLFDDPAIAVIDICTPPASHRGLIERALAAGKLVICEKPLVGSLAEIDELMRFEAAHGARILPVFQYRYGQELQKLKHLVELGIARRHYLTTVELAWRRGPDYYATPWRGKWRSELGGVLVTQAIHFLNVLAYILGPVRRVFASTATRVNAIEVEDCAAAVLEFADGSLATLAATLGSAHETTRLRFCFDGLSAESGADPYNPGTAPWRFVAAPELAPRMGACLADFTPAADGFAGLFARFATALETGAPWPLGLSDARRAIELITALYLSAESGRAVPLPLPPGSAKYAGWTPSYARSTGG